jgi:hypothetical protein
MFINVIFEVGLITEGFSIIRKQFMNPDDLSLNPILVGEILSSIQGLIPSNGSPIPKVLEIEQFIVLLQSFVCGKNSTEFLLYAICQASTQMLHTTLSSLVKDLKSFDSILLNWNVDSEGLRNLYPLFEEAFLPLNR